MRRMTESMVTLYHIHSLQQSPGFLLLTFKDTPLTACTTSSRVLNWTFAFNSEQGLHFAPILMQPVMWIERIRHRR
jgi:hypothetical protein